MTNINPDALLEQLDSIPTPGLEGEGERRKTDKDALASEQGIVKEMDVVEIEEKEKVNYNEIVEVVTLQRRPKDMNIGGENLVAEANVTLTNGITIRSIKVMRANGVRRASIRVVYPTTNNVLGQKVKLITLPQDIITAIEDAIYSEISKHV